MKHITSVTPSINAPKAKDIMYGQPFSYGGSLYMRCSCKSEKITLQKSKEYITAVNLKLGNIRGIDRCATVALIKVAVCDVDGEWTKEPNRGKEMLKFHPFEPVENGEC